MRILLLVAIIAAVSIFQPIDITAQEKGPPTFEFELVDFPAVVDHGQSLEGHIRITNHGAQRGRFRIKVNVDTPFGPATLADRSDVTIDAGETVSQPWAVRTSELEPGSYVVTIEVDHQKTGIVAPLRFTVQ